MIKIGLLINEFAAVLKPLGFKRKENRFFLINNDGNFGIIDFQKSKVSNVESNFSFTINLGVYSISIPKFYNESQSEIPKIEDCHWRKRIGQLFGSKEDYWWQVNNSTNLNELVNEIKIVLTDKAIPELISNISDMDLKKSWLNGYSSGITEVERYINLTILLKNENDKLGLDKVIQDFINFSKGKFFESTTKAHLKDMGYSFG